MLNAALVASAAPVAVATSVKPLPALSTLRSPKLATPDTAAAVFVPSRNAPSVLAASSTVTDPEKVTSMLPSVSRATTVIAGVMIGCTKASFLVALLAVSPPISLSQPVLIAAELRGLLEPDQIQGLDVTWLPADQSLGKGDWVAIVPLLSRWVGGTQLKHLPRLRIIANCAVGYDNVDVVAAEMRKVIVTNTPDVLTDATADLTWALILTCARRLVEGIDLVRSGRWTGWHPEQLLGV